MSEGHIVGIWAFVIGIYIFTPFDILCFRAFIATFNFGYLMLIIWMASMAAFFDPPIATVATGTPARHLDYRINASKPSRPLDSRGMPMTGSIVCDATTPGR